MDPIGRLQRGHDGFCVNHSRIQRQQNMPWQLSLCGLVGKLKQITHEGSTTCVEDIPVWVWRLEVVTRLCVLLYNSKTKVNGFRV